MTQYNILIVDDQASVHTDFDFILDSPRYQLLHATNRTEALELLKQFKLPPDTPAPTVSSVLALAIIDQNLGDYDPATFHNDQRREEGLALIDQIKGEYSPVTRVVINTAYFATAENRGFQAAEAGADDYWDKGKKESGSNNQQQIKDLVEHQLEIFKEFLQFHNDSLSQKSC